MHGGIQSIPAFLQKFCYLLEKLLKTISFTAVLFYLSAFIQEHSQKRWLFSTFFYLTHSDGQKQPPSPKSWSFFHTAWSSAHVCRSGNIARSFQAFPADIVQISLYAETILYLTFPSSWILMYKNCQMPITLCSPPDNFPCITCRNPESHLLFLEHPTPALVCYCRAVLGHMCLLKRTRRLILRAEWDFHMLSVLFSCLLIFLLKILLWRN